MSLIFSNEVYVGFGPEMPAAASSSGSWGTDWSAWHSCNWIVLCPLVDADLLTGKVKLFYGQLLSNDESLWSQFLKSSLQYLIYVQMYTEIYFTVCNGAEIGLQSTISSEFDRWKWVQFCFGKITQICQVTHSFNDRNLKLKLALCGHICLLSLHENENHFSRLHGLAFSTLSHKQQ